MHVFAACVCVAGCAGGSAFILEYAWLVEHQAEHGEFSEDELRLLAAESGVHYVGPGRAGESAA